MDDLLPTPAEPIVPDPKPIFHALIVCEEDGDGMHVSLVQDVPPEHFRRRFIRGYQFDLLFHYSPESAACLTQTDFRFALTLAITKVLLTSGLHFRTRAENQHRIEYLEKKLFPHPLDEPFWID
ncbi:MAG: hypothetical protein HXY41_04465 [Chloroflexi bacterium]|nr:hypothetical protein [Chloroflexota bacterium]